METKKVVIVDDHQLISAGIRSLIHHMQPRIELVECGCAREALQLVSGSGQSKSNGQIKQTERYDLLLIDINMPSFNGLDLLNALKSRKIKIPAAMISGTSDTRKIQHCIDAGAVGFIPKTAHPRLIIEGLGKLLNGERFMPPHLENYVLFDGLNKINDGTRIRACRSAHQNPVKTAPSHTQSAAEIAGEIRLKKREREVLSLIQDGKSNKQIAVILNISVSTVKFHITNLFRKFNARSRTECISLATHKLVLDD